MAYWLSSIAAVCLMVLGLCALALSQITHLRRVTLQRQLLGTRVLRCGATLLLASSLLMSLSSQGFVMGAVIWTLSIAPSGIGVTILLCWYKHERKK
ncbi:DUF3325 family protein [Pseudomonas sp. NFACC44-2]|uniref:DUF3325 family protein n=1 Tax=unclassified Pseudomonas TaxID=196821 RepID=UPI000B8404C7